MSDSDSGHAGHIRALDGLRACAAIAVVLFHFQADVFRGGSLGVDVFFVLSGFLITGLLVAEHRVRGRINLRRFYLRRALRLVPALVVAVVVGGIVYTGKGGHVTAFLPWAAAALAYVTNFFAAFGHLGPLNMTWSLGVEEQFYLLWPAVLVVLAVRQRGLMASAAAAFVVTVVLHLVVAAWGSADQEFYLPFSRFDETLGGGLLAIALTKERPRTFVIRACRGVTAWPAAAVFVLLLLRTQPTGLSAFAERLLVTLVTVIVLGYVTTRQRSPMARILSTRPAVWIGQRSYSLYLYHLFVLAVLVNHLPPHPSESLPILFAVALAVAHLSYVIVERPFLRRKDRLAAVDHRSVTGGDGSRAVA